MRKITFVDWSHSWSLSEYQGHWHSCFKTVARTPIWNTWAVAGRQTRNSLHSNVFLCCTNTPCSCRLSYANSNRTRTEALQRLMCVVYREYVHFLGILWATFSQRLVDTFSILYLVRYIACPVYLFIHTSLRSCVHTATHTHTHCKLYLDFLMHSGSCPVCFVHCRYP